MTVPLKLLKPTHAELILQPASMLRSVLGKREVKVEIEKRAQKRYEQELHTKSK